MPLYYDSTVIYLIPGIILGLYAQIKIKSAYGKNSKIDSGSGKTGALVAREILDRNGLYNVSIERIGGELTDHYDPRDKVLRLSDGVYNSSSIAGVSVAAHEVGHAIQDSLDYKPLRARNSIFPLASIGSNLSYMFILLGLFFSRFLLQLGIALFVFTVLFQIVTLPVEFDASRRAKEELSKGFVSESALKGSSEVLSAAALTYVAATLTAILQLLRLLSISRDRD